jgi:hypothetical protein
MPDSFYAKITPVGPEGPVDPGYGHPGGGGGQVTPPIALPPLPPGFKPPDISWKPGDGHPSAPIFIPIPGHPDNTLPTPPGGPPHVGGGPAQPPVPPPTVGGGPIPPPTVWPPPIPPGTVWPPLNPGDGVQGPGLLLVIVLGADGRYKTKWVSIGPGVWPPLPPPPVATPK